MFFRAISNDMEVWLISPGKGFGDPIVGLEPELGTDDDDDGVENDDVDDDDDNDDDDGDDYDDADGDGDVRFYIRCVSTHSVNSGQERRGRSLLGHPAEKLGSGPSSPHLRNAPPLRRCSG